jgi:hypothetical protein
MVLGNTLNAILFPKLSWIIVAYMMYYSGITPFNTQHYFFNGYGVDVNRYLVIMTLTVKGLEAFNLSMGVIFNYISKVLDASRKKEYVAPDLEGPEYSIINCYSHNAHIFLIIVIWGPMMPAIYINGNL